MVCGLLCKEVMYLTKRILPSAFLLMVLASNMFAQENITDATERRRRRFSPHEISFIRGAENYDEESSPGNRKYFYITAEPLSNKYDINDMLRKNMAWEKDVSFQKSHPQDYRLSVGIIKLNTVMCGAMLRVKFH